MFSCGVCKEEIEYGEPVFKSEKDEKIIVCGKCYKKEIEKLK